MIRKVIRNGVGRSINWGRMDFAEMELAANFARGSLVLALTEWNGLSVRNKIVEINWREMYLRYFPIGKNLLMMRREIFPSNCHMLIF